MTRQTNQIHPTGFRFLPCQLQRCLYFRQRRFSTQQQIYLIARLLQHRCQFRHIPLCILQRLWPIQLDVLVFVDPHQYRHFHWLRTVQWVCH
ncbi:MAG: hypothetical protein R3B84_20785 [Zavarzinella sp.]